MKVQVSQQLIDLYKKQHKNYDGAINFALDSFDPDSFVECFKIIEKFSLKGKKTEISIGEEVANRVASDLELESLDDMTAEVLLWIGAVFPEV